MYGLYIYAHIIVQQQILLSLIYKLLEKAVLCAGCPSDIIIGLYPLVPLAHLSALRIGHPDERDSVELKCEGPFP